MASTTFPLDEGFQDAYKASPEQAAVEEEGRSEYRDPLADFFGETRLSRVLDAEYDRVYRLEFAREAVRKVVGKVRQAFGPAADGDGDEDLA